MTLSVGMNSSRAFIQSKLQPISAKTGPTMQSRAPTLDTIEEERRCVFMYFRHRLGSFMKIAEEKIKLNSSIYQAAALKRRPGLPTHQSAMTAEAKEALDVPMAH